MKRVAVSVMIAAIMLSVASPAIAKGDSEVRGYAVLTGPGRRSRSCSARRGTLRRAGTTARTPRSSSRLPTTAARSLRAPTQPTAHAKGFWPFLSSCNRPDWAHSID